MSFTSIVKNEVSKLESTKKEKLKELSAIISSGAVIEESLKITTENASVAKRIFNLTKDLFEISPIITMRKGFNYQKKHLYILKINDKDILKKLNIFDNNILFKEELEDKTKRAYLRGIFLMTGSINDPKTSRYHLEFLINDEELGIYLRQLLNDFNLNAKLLKRENKFMVYIKEAEKIGDFLRVISAHNAVMYYEDIRIYRDYKNMTNRLNNCEQANVDRIIQTADSQVKDIELILQNVGLELLDEKEQIVAKYRLKYKDVSLSELSEIISIETGKTITKSGLYHRFKKISELAKKIKND